MEWNENKQGIVIPKDDSNSKHKIWLSDITHHHCNKSRCLFEGKKSRTSNE